MNRLDKDFLLTGGIVSFSQYEFNGKLITVLGENHSTDHIKFGLCSKGKDISQYLIFLKKLNSVPKFLLELDQPYFDSFKNVDYTNIEKLVINNSYRIYTFLDYFKLPEDENIFLFDMRIEINNLTRNSEPYPYYLMYSIDCILEYNYQEKYPLDKSKYKDEYYNIISQIRNNLEEDKKTFSMYKERTKAYFKKVEYMNLKLFLKTVTGFNKREQIMNSVEYDKFNRIFGTELFLPEFVSVYNLMFTYMIKISDLHLLEYILRDDAPEKMLVLTGDSHAKDISRYLGKGSLLGEFKSKADETLEVTRSNVRKNSDEFFCINLRGTYY